MRAVKLIRGRFGKVGRQIGKYWSELKQSNRIDAFFKYIWRNTNTISGRSALVLTIVLSIVLLRIVSIQAATNGQFFVKNSNTNIGSFPSSIPNNSFRIDTSTTNSASVSSISSSFVGSSSATLSPTTGWTQVVSNSVDDGNVNIPFGFSTTFNGTSYSSTYVGSNTYLT